MSKRLFDDDQSDDDTDFKTNKDYAKSYNKFRQKELLKKLKDKDVGNDSGSSSDSDSSEDDEMASNPKFDKEFYKTLSSLKRKDPCIYEKTTTFFDDTELITDSGTGSKQPRKLTVKQYEQDMLLKNSAAFVQNSDDEARNVDGRGQSPSYNEEQKMIKNEILGQISNIDKSDDEDDIGGLFSKREKSNEEQEKDEEEQAKWLDEHSELKEKSINDIWASKKLSKDEKFLRDYILSNGYADKEDDEIPTYDEIVGDDDFEEKQTEFEYKYNFRYEDPDQEFIKRYPRTIENSVRKVDSRRKEQRAARQERKELEKKEKFQEIEMLKELKRKEIDERMSQLKAVIGEDELNMDDIDLDGDFDPEEHDKKMQVIFDNDYYAIDEGDEKPEAPSDIEDLQVENYDEMENMGKANTDAHCEDDDFNMDCDYDESQPDRRKTLQDEIIESTRGRRKHRKRKSKFMEMFETKRPSFNPDDEKTYSEYLDEYYQLDCEDIIGDVKCRFKYVETVPCDYGLSIEEILLSKNKELNAWASLKKATQIRPEHVERNEQMIFQKKAKNDALKRKILHSLYEPSDEEEEVHPNEKSIVVVKNKSLSRINDEQITSVEKQDQAKTRKEKKPQVLRPIITETAVVEKQDDATNNMKPITRVESKKQSKTKNHEQLEKFSTLRNQIKTQTPQKQVKQKTASIKKKTLTEKFQSKLNNPLKKVAQKTISKRIKPNNQNSKGLSDERLKAFGINPKKFSKQQKYAQQKTGNSKSAAQIKHKNKLKDKLKKALM